MTVTFLPPIFHEKEKIVQNIEFATDGRFWGRKSVMDQIVLSGLAFCCSLSNWWLPICLSKADGPSLFCFFAETVNGNGGIFLHFINGVVFRILAFCLHLTHCHCLWLCAASFLFDTIKPSFVYLPSGPSCITFVSTAPLCICYSGYNSTIHQCLRARSSPPH